MSKRNRHKPSKKNNPVNKVYNLIKEGEKVSKQRIGTAYALCIVHERIYGKGSIDWTSLNKKLIQAFQFKGLEIIKKEAWSILENEAKKMEKEKNDG